ncbi:ABC-type Mn2+/Zn2+ transport system, permease component [Methanomethylovorans hollandica DSM 15978]|uniref:ABC-type Mn2+/Zn2+ transport system, permease component n=1 Tax=Methanomethylovorans hollandica (strain DSM 15978 / NBRC 107637 / DMS1) TaxID=867904 RepID=L0KXZ4_METHD|nr:metal ABC transporter permease [Methanomethylovorans hollandica]AGB50302.1 ABC-type Mn2+/Zn2+ transport system, permease component [Methanomethylovorans hollandica DSM 15978]
MIEILQYDFMRNALFTAILVSIACGIIGVYVVVKKIVSISGGISHASFGGVGLGYFLGINPLYGLIPFSLFSALAMGLVSKRAKMSEDTATGILWSLGMAIGIVFINLTPGYAPDLMTYLFGNILTVSTSDLYVMLALDALIVVIVYVFYKEFMAMCFDEEFASVIGVPVERMYLLLLCLIALTIVLLIKVVGIILIIALLTMPASLSAHYTHNLRNMMYLSMFFGAFFSITGLSLSYLLDIPSGATIILVMAGVYIIHFIYDGLTKKVHA